MLPKMRTFHICCLFVVLLSITHYIKGVKEHLKNFDDINFEYNKDTYELVYKLAEEYGKIHNHKNYVAPYRRSDYLKLSYDVIPPRYKKKLIDYFEKFMNENLMTDGEAAFEAVRYSTEDMMDIYQGRIGSAEEMARFKEIRATDPMRFMVAAAVYEKTWLEYSKEGMRGEKPTFQDFRNFVKNYYKNNPPKVRPAEN